MASVWTCPSGPTNCPLTMLQPGASVAALLDGVKLVDVILPAAVLRSLVDWDTIEGYSST